MENEWNGISKEKYDKNIWNSRNILKCLSPQKEYYL